MYIVIAKESIAFGQTESMTKKQNHSLKWGEQKLPSRKAIKEPLTISLLR
jgi:hypothetical protein